MESDIKNSRAEIEAILFAAVEPVGVAKLAKHLGLTQTDCGKILEELKNFYRDSRSGLAIVEHSKAVQLVAAKEFGQSIALFLNQKLNEPLSRTALEVLAVVAYRGPMTRAQIEYIRGVNCSFSLRNLAMRGLVERSDNPADSRSYLYSASVDFLKNMGLEKLEDLPDYEALHESESAQESDNKA